MEETQSGQTAQNQTSTNAASTNGVAEAPAVQVNTPPVSETPPSQTPNSTPQSQNPPVQQPTPSVSSNATRNNILLIVGLFITAIIVSGVVFVIKLREVMTKVQEAQKEQSAETEADLAQKEKELEEYGIYVTDEGEPAPDVDMFEGMVATSRSADEFMEFMALIEDNGGTDEALVRAEPILSKYISYMVNDDLYDLTKENYAKTHPSGIGTVPAVVEQGSTAKRVYVDESRVILNIPNGWYGIENATDQMGVFYYREADLIMSTNLVQLVTDVDNSKELQVFLQNDPDMLADLHNAEYTDPVYQIYDDNHLFEEYTSDELRYVSYYTVFPQFSNLFHHMRMAVPIDSDMSNQEMKDLLLAITEGDDYIGLDPEKPAERNEFLDIYKATFEQ